MYVVLGICLIMPLFSLLFFPQRLIKMKESTRNLEECGRFAVLTQEKLDL